MVDQIFHFMRDAVSSYSVGMALRGKEGTTEVVAYRPTRPDPVMPSGKPEGGASMFQIGIIVGVVLFIALFFIGWGMWTHFHHVPDHYERENIAGFDCLVQVEEGGRTLIGCEGLQR